MQTFVGDEANSIVVIGVWHTNVVGTVRVQTFVGDEAHSIVILKDVDLATFPPVGLSRERVQYLYKEIREFCDHNSNMAVLVPG